MTDTTTRTSDDTQPAPPSGGLDPTAVTPGAYSLWHGRIPAPLVPVAEYSNPFDPDEPAPSRTGWYLLGLGTEADVEAPVANVDHLTSSGEPRHGTLDQEAAKTWFADQIEHHTGYRVKGWRLEHNGDPDAMRDLYRQAWVPTLVYVDHHVTIFTGGPDDIDHRVDGLAWRVIERQLRDVDEVIKIASTSHVGTTWLFPVRRINGVRHSVVEHTVPQFDPFEVPF